MEGFGGHARSTSVIAKRFLITSVKSFYSSARHHPLLFVFVFFMFLLYRSFPCVFAFLVSSTPVLLCTALLLGVLLSYGQPNPPEIDDEIRRTHEIASLRISLSEGETTAVEERAKDFTVERFVLRGSGGADEGFPEIRSKVPLGNVLTKEDEPRGVVRDGSWASACASMDDGDGGAVRSPYVPIREEDDIVERDIATTGNPFDPEKFPPTIESGKLVQEENTGFSDSGSSDSESDEAESSSPDELSLPDIVPASVDELHPLLNSEALQPSNADAASEVSHTEDSHEEDGEDDNEEEDGEDDNEEDEDEHGHDESKRDEMKSPITWTEDDQKNLMDLGTLELERNQRLENLIVRRRARKNMKMMVEKNLIDLDGSDLPFSGPHISTSKHNPFDLPYEQSDNTPPPPGSAPSVLLPGRNPFDLPYGSAEENPNQIESGFSVYRRHESFSAGPSVLGFPRGNRQEVRFRPFFVPEEREEDEEEEDDDDNGEYLHGRFSSSESSIAEIDSTSSPTLKMADGNEDVIPSPSQPGLSTTSVTKSSSDTAIDDDHDGECSSTPPSSPENDQKHQLSASAMPPLHAPARKEILPCQHSASSDDTRVSLDVVDSGTTIGENVGEESQAKHDPDNGNGAVKPKSDNGNGAVKSEPDRENGVVRLDLDSRSEAGGPSQASVGLGADEGLVKEEM